MPDSGVSSSSAAPAAEKPVWLELAIQEYNALREEILTTMRTQDGTLRFGAATVGIVTAAGFNVWDDTVAATMIFLAVVPFICTIVLIIWMGEVTRMMRAGRHLQRLEEVFAHEIPYLPAPVMKWETNLRDQEADNTRWDRHYEWNYHAIVLMFWSLGIGAIAAGLYRGVWGDSPLEYTQAVWIAAVAICAATLLALIVILRELATVCDTQGKLQFMKKRAHDVAGAGATARS